MINFGLDEDARMLMDTVRMFAERELRPNLRKFEEQGIPAALDKAFHELGVSSLSLPESVGGADMGERHEMLVLEELGAGDLGTSFALSGPGSFAVAVQVLGDEAQQKAWLKDFVENPSLRGAVAYSEDSGHPDDGLATRAVKKGDAYVLHGKKSPVLQAQKADRFVVFATVEGEGLSAFVVEKSRKGLTIGERAGMLALDAAGFAPVMLENVEVPSSHRLMGKNFQEVFVRSALRGAARIVGGARAAYGEALAYAQTRTTFGKPIGHHQAVGFLLADMATAVDSMRWLLWSAAAALDEKREDAVLQACKAIAEVQETGMWVANQAVQVHGGAGFIQDLPLEKWMREAKALMSFGLTPAAADAITAELMLGRTDLPLAEALPAAAIQPVFL